jgi:hypothetical protein
MGALKIIGMPTTLLIDASGREVWRVVGPAEWDAPDVVETLRKTIAAPASVTMLRASSG